MNRAAPSLHCPLQADTASQLHLSKHHLLSREQDEEGTIQLYWKHHGKTLPVSAKGLGGQEVGVKNRELQQAGQLLASSLQCLLCRDLWLVFPSPTTPETTLQPPTSSSGCWSLQGPQPLSKITSAAQWLTFWLCNSSLSMLALSSSCFSWRTEASCWASLCWRAS